MRFASQKLGVVLTLATAGCYTPDGPLVIDAGATEGGSTQGQDSDASSLTASGTGGPGTSPTAGPPTSGGTTPATSQTTADDTTGGDTAVVDDSGVTTDEPTSRGVTTDEPTSRGETTDGETTDGETTDGETTDDTSDSEACVQDCSGIACGQDPLCNMDCPSQCSAAATCAEDQTYCALALGNSVFLGNDANVVGGIVIGHRITIPSATNLKAFGVIAGSAGANVQMALYTDADGPQTRMRQTGEVTLQNDENVLDVSDTALTPGDYWVVLHTQGTTSLGRTATGDNDHELAFLSLSYPGDGSNSFPLTLNGDQVVSDYRYNIYVLVEE